LSSLQDINQEIPIENYIDLMFENLENKQHEERLCLKIMEILKDDLQRFVSNLVTTNISNIKHENIRLETG